MFGAVTLTKNADIDMYKYSGYGIGFDDRHGFFSHPSGGNGRNVIIFQFINLTQRILKLWQLYCV